MGPSRFLSVRKGILFAIVLVIAAAETGWCGPQVGQSAVITLVMPPGARSTGMAESFTGMANDANAVYYNPAGLGQAPLANAWRSFTPDKGPFLAVASRTKSNAFTSQLVWAGTPKGLIRFTGKGWETSESYLVEQGDEVKSVTRRFLNVDDEKLLLAAAMKIRAVNGIEMKRFDSLVTAVKKAVADSNVAKAQAIPETVAEKILELSPGDRSSAKIYLLLSPYMDSLKADTVSDHAAKLLTQKDDELKSIVELKVPFSIAIHDSITAMAMDDQDRLWVGTTQGLWRCSESKWTRVTVSDGLPSNFITCLVLGSYGTIAVGTKAGAAAYKGSSWMKIGGADGLTDTNVTAVTIADSALYIGTAKGLFQCTNWGAPVLKTVDTAGLLSSNIRALFYDNKNRLWVGVNNGVSVFDGKSWKRFKFPGTSVQCFSEQSNGTVWIGTSNGAVTYKEGAVITGKNGKTQERAPIWKAYHSKSVLRGDRVLGFAPFGNDMWIVTDQAINKYEWAQLQASLFYEQLLPSFHISDLWHVFGSAIVPFEEWGTLGFSANFVNMGTTKQYDELGRELGNIRSWEGVFGLSYGLPLSQTFSVGLNIKYAYSALAPGVEGSGTGIGQTFAVDVAMLKREFLTKRLSLGFMLQNMGPPVYYLNPELRDPIPFTLRLGTSYSAIETPIHELSILCDLEREVVKNYGDGNPDPFYKALWTNMLHDTLASDRTVAAQLQLVTTHLGAEYWYSHFLALRSGFMMDVAGQRYELTFGLGLNYGNMNFDWSYIYSPEGFMKGIVQKFESDQEGSTGARDGQMRFSFIFHL